MLEVSIHGLDSILGEYPSLLTMVRGVAEDGVPLDNSAVIGSEIIHA